MYGTWPVAVSKEPGIKVPENKVLMRILVPDKEEMTG
jgi:hypothetical protein